MNIKITAAMYVYFVFVGACYLLGFWTPLHFNILQFVSPMDLIKSAVYPIIPSIIGVSVLALMDAYNSQGVTPPDKDAPKDLKITFKILTVFIILNFLLLVSVFIYFLYNAIMSEPDRRLYYVFPIASFISTYLLINHAPSFPGISKFSRNLIIISGCLLPLISYYQGDKNINNIFNGEASYYKLKKETDVCKTNESSDMIYMGLLGDRYIFIDSQNRDICIDSNKSISLTYHEYDNKKNAKVIDDVDDKDTNNKASIKASTK